MNKGARFKAHVKQMSQRPEGISEAKAVAMMKTARPTSSASARKHAKIPLAKPKKGGPGTAVDMDGNDQNPRRPGGVNADDKTTFE